MNESQVLYSNESKEEYNKLVVELNQERSERERLEEAYKELLESKIEKPPDPPKKEESISDLVHLNVARMEIALRLVQLGERSEGKAETGSLYLAAADYLTWQLEVEK